MQLKFYAKCGANNHPPPVVHWPGKKANGQLYNYVGRKYDAKSRIHKALPEPVVVDSESRDGKRLAEVCRRDYDLWPADEATAQFCSREFVRVTLSQDGEWVPTDESEADKAGLVKRYRDGKRRLMCAVAKTEDAAPRPTATKTFSSKKGDD